MARAFRAKSIEERKSLVRKHHLCFRCLSSVSHMAKDCKFPVKCSECGSDRHLAALHVDPPPPPPSLLTLERIMAGRKETIKNHLITWLPPAPRSAPVNLEEDPAQRYVWQISLAKSTQREKCMSSSTTYWITTFPSCKKYWTATTQNEYL